MIRVVAVGKRHESWVAEGIERYEARLKKPFDVEWLDYRPFGVRGRQGASGRV